MEIKNNKNQNHESLAPDFFTRLWEESWTYIKTVVDIVREPVLILDKDFRVLAANDCFYSSFKVKPKDTEAKIIYELGNGQWNIPALKKLLKDILPKNTFLKGFEVTHEFPSIGRKVMILNARQIHFKDAGVLRHIILLSIEDVTEMMTAAETFSNYANHIELEFIERIKNLEQHIEIVEKDFNKLKNNK